MEPSEKQQEDYLRRLKQRALALDSDVFEKEYAGFYLLLQIPEEAQDEWSFTTDIRMMDNRGLPMSPKAATHAVRRLLYRIEKTERNAFSTHISIGRATNNDIIIRHHSVSKLHAHFYLGSRGIFRKKTTDLQLADVGSANGTVANGSNLKDGDAETVPAGSHVTFGEIHGEILDAAKLYKRLRTILI